MDQEKCCSLGWDNGNPSSPLNRKHFERLEQLGMMLAINSKQPAALVDKVLLRSKPALDVFHTFMEHMCKYPLPDMFGRLKAYIAKDTANYPWLADAGQRDRLLPPDTSLAHILATAQKEADTATAVDNFLRGLDKAICSQASKQSAGSLQNARADDVWSQFYHLPADLKREAGHLVLTVYLLQWFWHAAGAIPEQLLEWQTQIRNMPSGADPTRATFYHLAGNGAGPPSTRDPSAPPLTRDQVDRVWRVPELVEAQARLLAALSGELLADNNRTMASIVVSLCYATNTGLMATEPLVGHPVHEPQAIMGPPVPSAMAGSSTKVIDAVRVCLCEIIDAARLAGISLDPRADNAALWHLNRLPSRLLKTWAAQNILRHSLLGWFDLPPVDASSDGIPTPRRAPAAPAGPAGPNTTGGVHPSDGESNDSSDTVTPADLDGHVISRHGNMRPGGRLGWNAMDVDDDASSTHRPPYMLHRDRLGLNPDIEGYMGQRYTRTVERFVEERDGEGRVVGGNYVQVDEVESDEEYVDMHHGNAYLRFILPGPEDPLYIMSRVLAGRMPNGDRILCVVGHDPDTAEDPTEPDERWYQDDFDGPNEAGADDSADEADMEDGDEGEGDDAEGEGDGAEGEGDGAERREDSAGSGSTSLFPLPPVPSAAPAWEPTYYPATRPRQLGLSTRQTRARWRAEDLEAYVRGRGPFSFVRAWEEDDRISLRDMADSRRPLDTPDGVFPRTVELTSVSGENNNPVDGRRDTARRAAITTALRASFPACPPLLDHRPQHLAPYAVFSIIKSMENQLEDTVPVPTVAVLMAQIYVADRMLENVRAWSGLPRRHSEYGTGSYDTTLHIEVPTLTAAVASYGRRFGLDLRLCLLRDSREPLVGLEDTPATANTKYLWIYEDCRSRVHSDGTRTGRRFAALKRMASLVGHGRSSSYMLAVRQEVYERWDV